MPVRPGSGEVVAAVNIGGHAAGVMLETMRQRSMPELRLCADVLGAALHCREVGQNGSARILVTGSSGHLGEALKRQWRSEDAAAPRRAQALIRQPVRMIQVETASAPKKNTSVTAKLTPMCISASPKKLQRKPLIR